MNWFAATPFMGSAVPITYDEEQNVTDETGTVIFRGKSRRVIGYVGVTNIFKFMEDMKKIQDEVRI